VISPIWALQHKQYCFGDSELTANFAVNLVEKHRRQSDNPETSRCSVAGFPIVKRCQKSDTQIQKERLTGDNADDLVGRAMDDALCAAKAQREHLVTSAVLRAARERIMTALPKRADVKAGAPSVNIDVDISALRAVEEARFDDLASAADWNGLITRYPLRESSAFDCVVRGLKVADQTTYSAAVLKLVQDDAEALKDLRDLLGGLYVVVTT
jgi:hypothetical protein